MTTPSASVQPLQPSAKDLATGAVLLLLGTLLAVIGALTGGADPSGGIGTVFLLVGVPLTLIGVAMVVYGLWRLASNVDRVLALQLAAATHAQADEEQAPLP